MNKAVECKRLSKAFDSGTKALDQIDLVIEENKIIGLLGRNGAGKTTLLKIIANQFFPTGGSVEVFGQNPYENEAILEKICFIRESAFYPKEFRVRDILETAEGLYPDWDHQFSEKLSAKFELKLDKKFKTLSKGMQSAVSIIVGLAARAPITIFDEAYLGLDAAKRQLFYDILLEDYSKHPRTVIFSSHLIDECKNLFEEVMILEEGKVLLRENMEAINEKSFYVAGRKDKVEGYLKGKKVLHNEGIGRMVSAAVFSNITEEEQRMMWKDDVELQPMPLQKLFIYMTSKNGGRSDE